jgi:hypothetical protein
VDDFVLIHRDKDYLTRLIPAICNYLKDELLLELHPKKIFLQHYYRGLSYLGAVIKPHRIYIANRTKGNFHDAVYRQNLLARDHKPSPEERKMFLSSMNSYMGIMKHYKTYKIRHILVRKKLTAWWCNYVKTNKTMTKFTLK